MTELRSHTPRGTTLCEAPGGILPLRGVGSTGLSEGRGPMLFDPGELPCFADILGCFGLLGPKFTICPFDPKMAYHTSKTLDFKGKVSNFDAKML